MKTIKDKQVLVAADFAGATLKNAVVEHLQQKGWSVTDIGVQSSEDKNPEMFHRIGLKVGSKITEKEFERALIFCGTGMGIHIAASKCPGVHCAVVESIPAALRCITGNDCNIMAMGGFYVSEEDGKVMADMFLEHNLGDGYDDWENFIEFHQLAIDELNNFNYDEFKANGFQLTHLGEVTLGPIPSK